MTTFEILQKLDLAIETLFSNDRYLLERELNERSIAFKLGEYLQPLFNGYNVDCEYNGDAGKENDIKALKIAKDEIEAIGKKANENDIYRISPDIIIHKRGFNTDNLLVIEVKKDNSQEQFKNFDLIKLKHLTIPYFENHYIYQLGVALVFNTGANTGNKEMTFFQNGNKIDNRTDLQ